MYVSFSKDVLFSLTITPCGCKGHVILHALPAQCVPGHILLVLGFRNTRFENWRKAKEPLMKSWDYQILHGSLFINATNLIFSGVCDSMAVKYYSELTELTASSCSTYRICPEILYAHFCLLADLHNIPYCSQQWNYHQLTIDRSVDKKATYL